METDAGAESLKDFIRRRRQELGLSCSGLAKAIGVSRITIYWIENGTIAHLRFKLLPKWTEVLQVDYADVLRFYTPEQARSKPTQTDGGKKLRRARIEKRLNQQELARLTGVSCSIISQLESGQLRPLVTSDRLENLAAILGLEPADLASCCRTVRKKYILSKELAGDPLGDLFRIQRIKRQLRQVDMAGQLSISSESLSRIECGKLRPSSRLVRRLEVLYDCAVPLMSP